MKRSKLQRLVMAVMAATMLFGGASQAVSTEISAGSFVTSLQQYVENGEYAAAKDALRQLQALGINQIQVGDAYYFISDILLILEDPDQARLLMATLMDSVTNGVTAYFVAEDRVVASVDWLPTGAELFPTGSAG
jgi:hypothetical protein